MKVISEMIREVLFSQLLIKDGYGIWYFSNNDKFSGKFENDQADGKGTYYKSDGQVISGNWLLNKFN